MLAEEPQKESTVLFLQNKANPPKESVAQEGHRLVNGARRGDYGHPLDDFSRAGHMATGLLLDKLKPGCTITATDIPKLVILIKLSREMNHEKRDNLVDICGYAATNEMVIDEQQRRYQEGERCAE
ncbi:hypothetical protein [uncultured Mediterranean phage]|nr:hypothetical protein [uncultured Mediterranean phage]